MCGILIENRAMRIAPISRHKDQSASYPHASTFDEIARQKAMQIACRCAYGSAGSTHSVCSLVLPRSRWLKPVVTFLLSSQSSVLPNKTFFPSCWTGQDRLRHSQRGKGVRISTCQDIQVWQVSRKDGCPTSTHP